MNIFDIGRACHDISRAYNEAIGDPVQAPWDEISEPQRQGLLSAVLGYVRNPLLTPEVAHASWMQSRLAEGWVWGPVLDREAKVHPNLVDYSKLSPIQKAKDFIFRQTVLSLAPHLLRIPPLRPEPHDTIVLIGFNGAHLRGRMSDLRIGDRFYIETDTTVEYIATGNPTITYTGELSSFTVAAQTVKEAETPAAVPTNEQIRAQFTEGYTEDQVTRFDQLVAQIAASRPTLGYAALAAMAAGSIWSVGLPDNVSHNHADEAPQDNAAAGTLVLEENKREDAALNPAPEEEANDESFSFPETNAAPAVEDAQESTKVSSGWTMTPEGESLAAPDTKADSSYAATTQAESSPAADSPASE